MLVTLLPMVREVRLKQPENASFPIIFTLLGIVMDVRRLQVWNALFPMLFTLLGMTVLLLPTISVLDAVSIIALQLLRLS